MTAVKCSFLSPDSVDVAIAKSTRLEIRQFIQPTADNDDDDDDNDSTEQLPLLLTLPINGRITTLTSIKFKHSKKDCLFFTTERGDYALISYDETLARMNMTGTAGTKANAASANPRSSAFIGEHYPVKTHASGAFTSYSTSVMAGGRQAECGPLMAVDPLQRCVALHVYDGYVTVIPINKDYDINTNVTKGLTTGPFKDAYHARIEERTLLSMAFLETSIDYLPQLSLMHQDARGFQHVITHGVDVKAKGMVFLGSIQKEKEPSDSSSKMPAMKMPPKHDRLKISRIDGGSATLIPIPPPPSRNSSKLGGVVILGQRQVTYHSTAEGITRVVPIAPSILLSYCPVMENDGNATPNVLRFLVGDEKGKIHLLTVLRNITPEGNGDGRVTTLHFDTLGSASASSALVYLGRGRVFVGSQFGDSQLVKILETPVPVSGGGNDEKKSALDQNTYLRILEEYTNLGPIVDFDLRPCINSASSDSASRGKVHGEVGELGKARDQHRQSLVVTASGVAKDGTVRLVRNGVGMREHAAVEMTGIKGMWGLRRKFSHDDDAFLVQSFVTETRILGVQNAKDADVDAMEKEGDTDDDSEPEGGVLAEVRIPGFKSMKPTLFAGNVMVGSFDLLLQVVDDAIRLVDSETLEMVTEWTAFSGDGDDDSDDDGVPSMITVASANESGQIVVALRGGTLLYFEVNCDGSPKLQRLGVVCLDREISCINLNPFNSLTPSASESGMDIGGDRVAKKSAMVAIGLWDDFSVCLLSLRGNLINPILGQILRINLAPGGDDGNGGFSETETEHNPDDLAGSASQHMMARSLCLVTLDSLASSNNAFVNKKLSTPAMSNKVDMLLVGLGDGKLISFVVNHSESTSDGCSVHSRKEVNLGTQGIHLVPFRHAASQQSGALCPNSGAGMCVLATGDRPTVVYLTGGNGGSTSNPKLSYSTISLTAEDDDEEDGNASHRNIFVNVAAPFRSSLLFSSTTNNSSLCVADDNTMRLGMIDNIQKLHVTSYKLGMTPTKIAYHEAGRVYCVGCIGGVDGGAGGGSNSHIGGETNMGNCVRFFDDSTFEEINRIDLEPFEMILSLESVILSLYSPDSPPASSSTIEDKPFVLIGTAYAYPDEDEPTQGRVLVVECNSGDVGHVKSDTEDDNLTRYIRHVTQMPTSGGVYSISPFYNGSVLLTINSKTHLCRLSMGKNEVGELSFIGSGHHGHMLSLCVKSLARNSVSEPNRQTNQLAIVGDLMRSISLVEYLPKHEAIEEVARDYNANYMTSIEMLTDGIYLGSENFNNLFVLRYNSDATSEEARVRLDTIGEYHLGEMTNKLMGGSLIMPNNSSNGTSAMSSSSSSRVIRSKSDKAPFEQNRKVSIIIGSQTLYGTVDGSIGSVLGLNGSTFAFLSSMQRAMTSIIKPVGGIGHQYFRAFHADRCNRPSRGFVDGDLIETFLDLNRQTMEKIVDKMNTDGRWKIRDAGLGLSDPVDNHQTFMDTDVGIENDSQPVSNSSFLTVDDVLCAVEEISMLH